MRKKRAAPRRSAEPPTHAPGGERLLAAGQRVGHGSRDHRADGFERDVVDRDRPRGQRVARALLHGISLAVNGNVAMAHGLFRDQVRRLDGVLEGLRGDLVQPRLLGQSLPRGLDVQVMVVGSPFAGWS